MIPRDRGFGERPAFWFVVKSSGLGVGKKVLEKREIQLARTRLPSDQGLMRRMVALPGDVDSGRHAREIVKTESTTIQGHQDERWQMLAYFSLAHLLASRAVFAESKVPEAAKTAFETGDYSKAIEI